VGLRLALPVALLAALALSAGAEPAPAPRIKNTKGWIESIAMDGPRVAYDVGAQGSACNKLFVWNVLTEGGALVSGEGTCGADSTSTGGGVVKIAVAGTRIAWIVNLGGNTESSDYLYTASLPHPTERRLASATRRGDVDSGPLEGGWIGGLVGDGDLLAVNTWATDDSGSVTRASLRSIGARGLSAIATGPGTIVAESADLGRIAVLRADGKVAIYSAGGTLLTAIAPSSAREVALRKDYVVVLTEGKTLEIYNASTGALVNTWPVPAGAAHLDVHSGIAVYSVWRTLHALRLTTGKDVALVTAKRKIVDVEIEAPGVAYAFNTVKRGKSVGDVVFLPFAQVGAAVG